MSNSETEFDYQSVLETCELQDQSAKRAQEGKRLSNSSYKNAHDNLKTLGRECKEKNETMFDILLKQKRNLQMLENTMNMQVNVNKEIHSVQNKFISLNSNLKEQSDDFKKKTAEVHQNIQELYTHFEEKTLETIIAGVSNELLSSQDIEIHLQNEFEKLVNNRNKTTTYAKCNVLKMLSKTMTKPEEHLKINEAEKKIAGMRKNIQFLTNQIEKMTSKH